MKLISLLPKINDSVEITKSKMVHFNQELRRRIEQFDREELKGVLFKDLFFSKSELKIEFHDFLPSIAIRLRISLESFNGLIKVDHVIFHVSLIDDFYSFHLLKEVREEYDHLYKGQRKKYVHYPAICDFNRDNFENKQMLELENRLKDIFPKHHYISFQEAWKDSPYQRASYVSNSEMKLYHVLFTNFTLTNKKVLV